MKKTTILFDFDWVIASTDDFAKNALKHACEVIWIERSDDMFTRYYLWKPFKDWVVKHLWTIKQRKHLEAFKQAKLSYDKHYIDEAIVYDDAIELIKRIADRYRCIIVTWSRIALLTQFLTHYNLSDYFTDVITSEEYSPWKPNPAPYLYALKKHWLSKQEVVVIEDSPAGHKSAKKAWLDMIIVRWDKEYAYTWCLDELSTLSNITHL